MVMGKPRVITVFASLWNSSMAEFHTGGSLADVFTSIALKAQGKSSIHKPWSHISCPLTTNIPFG